MKISIIGAGNVGSALAQGFSKVGHEVFIGTREIDSLELLELNEFSENISIMSINNAIKNSDIVVLSTPSQAVIEIAKNNPELKDKIIVDATNSVFKKPEPYNTAFHALKEILKVENIVKCFNTTGFENMKNPIYDGNGIDMFVAGSSKIAKDLAIKLSKEIGFEECYDFGDDSKVELIEQFAMSWINLAILQGYGRNIAFKIIKR